MSALTTNYSLIKPTDGGDTGAWGPMIDTSFDTIDTTLKANADAVALKAAKAGDTMTGKLDLFTTTLKRIDKGAISGAQSLDLSLGNCFTLTVSGALTPTFINPPAGTFLLGFILVINNGGSAAITWPASVKWPSGLVPSLTVAGRDVLVFISVDGGATWDGVVAMKDVR